MTKRDAFVAVINGDINAEVIEVMENEIAKMDRANEKARERKDANAEAKEAEVKAFAEAFITDEAKTASDIMADMVEAGFERADEKAVNVQFVSAMARAAVKAGFAVAEDVKVAKKGVQKAYTRA